jgi:hypothetical protein
MKTLRFDTGERSRAVGTRETLVGIMRFGRFSALQALRSDGGAGIPFASRDRC